MANLTMADVVEYFNAYRTKYSAELTLTIDQVEEVLNAVEDDDLEIILPALHDAMKPEGEETGPDRSDDNEADIPDSSDAFQYADAMSDDLAAELDSSAAAALQNKRGAAVIALKLITLHGLDTIVNKWPVPGSEGENGTKLIGNRVADYYKTTVHKDDGTSSVGERSWYRDYLERSKAAAVDMAKLKSIKAVTANEQAKYILPEHETVRGDKIKIKSKRAAIDGSLSNKKGAIVRAVSLIQRMDFLNKSTDFQCEIMMEPSQDNPEIMVPVASQKLVQVWDKKDQRTGNTLTIGQLLALKPIEGGTYQAITQTTGRKPKSGTGTDVQNVKIEKVEQYDDVTAAYAHFFERLRTDTKAMNAFLTHLNGAGSDDLLLSMNSIMTDIDSYLSKPAYQKRLATLLTNERNTSKVA